ncbi:MAG: 50S ribosomal protein L29 [Cyanobacteria bacterium J06554_11]
MALVKIKELRALSDEELATAIADTKRELFDLRFKQATRQLETGFHQFKHNRRKLAQLMTIERERQLAAATQETEKEA